MTRTPNSSARLVDVATLARPRWQQQIAAAAGLWSLIAGGVVGSVGCQLATVAPSLAVAARPAGFVLASTQGSLSSTQAFAKGPLVLIFYRGHW